MDADRSKFAAIAVLVVAGVTAVAGCSGSLGTGGSPTTTAVPLSAREMCTQGQKVFQDIDELDRKKPEYLDQVKKAVKPLADRPPAEIAEDMKAWVGYVQITTDKNQLANLPADMKVSTGRIDEWWKRNCGRPLIGS